MGGFEYHLQRPAGGISPVKAGNSFKGRINVEDRPHPVGDDHSLVRMFDGRLQPQPFFQVELQFLVCLVQILGTRSDLDLEGLGVVPVQPVRALQIQDHLIESFRQLADFIPGSRLQDPGRIDSVPQNIVDHVHQFFQRMRYPNGQECQNQHGAYAKKENGRDRSVTNYFADFSGNDFGGKADVHRGDQLVRISENRNYRTEKTAILAVFIEAYHFLPCSDSLQ
ncbi:MAG: hypothetical protein ACD_75C01862G0002 [uncultured bacterium]|nr:MAG: hypothetical protein ACD_75C01862G0002 [uncultured bacterium]